VIFQDLAPIISRIRSFLDLWFMPSLLGVLGLVFTAVGAWLLIFSVPA